MNYQGIYDAIVNRAKLEEPLRQLKKKTKTGYFERHHIIPRCMGGNDEGSNLVYLTAREHFICHKLLCEIHPGIKALHFALWNMINGWGPSYRHVVSNREYERARSIHSRMTTELLTGSSKSQDTKRKMSDAAKARKHSDEVKRKIAATLTGKKRGPYKKKSVPAGPEGGLGN